MARKHATKDIYNTGKCEVKAKQTRWNQTAWTTKVHSLHVTEAETSLGGCLARNQVTFRTEIMLGSLCDLSYTATASPFNSSARRRHKPHLRLERAPLGDKMIRNIVAPMDNSRFAIVSYHLRAKDIRCRFSDWSSGVSFTVVCGI